GALDGLADPEVGTAPADVLDLVDVLVGRLRGVLEQRDRGHDLAWLTETALGDVLVQPGLLHRVQRVAIGEALNVGHRAPGTVGHRRHAGLDLLAVQVTRARPAHADAAPVLRSGDPEL